MAVEQFRLLAVISTELAMDEPEDINELERKIAPAVSFRRFRTEDL